MSATAWYALGGGGNGPGRDELETDAFLVDEGTFVEPMPIASVTPADAWDHSDVNEFVITDTEASDVQALNTVGGHSNELFERWYALEGNAAPTLGHGLRVPQHDTGIAIATYRIPPAVGPGRLGVGEAIAGTIVGGVAHDGSGGIVINGVFHPIGPWNPLLAGLATLQAARGLQRDAAKQIQLETLRAMSSQLQHMEKEIEGGREV